MTKITDRHIDALLLLLSILTIALLSWMVLNEVDQRSQQPQIHHCVTEDEPGWCEWNGEVRYFSDDNNTIAA